MLTRHTAIPLLVAAALATGCAREELLHGLDEPQANEVLVALDDGGIPSEKAREDGPDAAWTISVGARDAARAQRLLAERELPRRRQPGFGDVFAKPSMVPTPTEEHAMYLHALAGELARSVEAIEGVVEARVHLGLPQPDPLRPGERSPPRGAVLVKCRASACPSVRALEAGIRALVAGAADGLDAAAVSVVVTEGAETPPPCAPAPRRRSAILMALAGVAAFGGLAVAAPAVRARLRREVTA